MTATKLWRLSNKRSVPAKLRTWKYAPSSYAWQNARGRMPSSSCSPTRSSSIWHRAGASSISLWKKASTPWRRSVSSKCRPPIPPAITASLRLGTPSRAYCTAPTSSSPRPLPSLARVCPRRKNSNQNGLHSKFNYLTGFQCFGLGGKMRWRVGEEVEVYHTHRNQLDLFTTPDEIKIEVEDFNRKVITESFNRVVCEFLAQELDPSSRQKTLIFCVNDAHADLVVHLLKRAFEQHYGSIDDDAVIKITGAADKPLQLIRRYKNERNPNVVVTVDLLTTGV